MIYAFAFSILLNVVFFLIIVVEGYLMRHLTIIAQSKPKQVIADAEPLTQAALRVAQAVTHLSAEEEQEQRELERREEWEASEALQDLGIDPRELERIGQLR